MSKTFLPNDDYMIISFSDLEVAWRMLASPDKHTYIKDSLITVREINRQIGPEKAIFNMITATAWLTSDDQTEALGFGSQDG